MRTAFSAFMALIVTISLVTLMATALDLRVNESIEGDRVESIVPRRASENETPLEQLIGNIDGSRQCSVDSDCVIATFGCPLDCYSPVAVTKLGSLNAQFAALGLAEFWSCAYWCVGVPDQAVASCIEGRCEMSIRGLPEDLARAVETVPMLLLDASRNGQVLRVYGYLRRQEGINVLFSTLDACVGRDTGKAWVEVRSYLQPPDDDRRRPCRRTMLIGRYEHGPFLVWGAGEASGRFREVSYFRLERLPIH